MLLALLEDKNKWAIEVWLHYRMVFFSSVYFCQLGLGNIFQEMRQWCCLGASLAQMGLHWLFVSALLRPSRVSSSALPWLPDSPSLSSLPTSSWSCIEKMQFLKVWEKGCSHAGVETRSGISPKLSALWWASSFRDSLSTVAHMLAGPVHLGTPSSPGLLL